MSPLCLPQVLTIIYFFFFCLHSDIHFLRTHSPPLPMISHDGAWQQSLWKNRREPHKYIQLTLLGKVRLRWTFFFGSPGVPHLFPPTWSLTAYAICSLPFCHCCLDSRNHQRDTGKWQRGTFKSALLSFFPTKSLWTVGVPYWKLYLLPLSVVTFCPGNCPIRPNYVTAPHVAGSGYCTIAGKSPNTSHTSRTLSNLTIILEHPDPLRTRTTKKILNCYV